MLQNNQQFATPTITWKGQTFSFAEARAFADEMGTLTGTTLSTTKRAYTKHATTKKTAAPAKKTAKRKYTRRTSK